VIGGVAVGVHGYVRATKDLDVCPAGDRENLEALARLLSELDAEQLEVGDFASDELPFDPRDAGDLAKGGNFWLRTRLGALDVATGPRRPSSSCPRSTARPYSPSARIGLRSKGSARSISFVKIRSERW